MKESLAILVNHFQLLNFLCIFQYHQLNSPLMYWLSRITWQHLQSLL